MKLMKRIPIAAAALLAACSNMPARQGASDAPTVFTLEVGGNAIARAITRAPACPALEAAGMAPVPMRVRAAPRTVPARGADKLGDNKPAVFDVLTCEADLPAAWTAGSIQVRIAGQPVPLPAAEVNTIVVLGDTGCRMKQPGNFFQDCEHSSAWPLAKIAGAAAALKPDLVVHVGDYHYRESPCPADQQSCAGSPWGYGFDAWNADFFRPASALLAAAPWVFVRGNHESCFRAGQGWFRFVAAERWTETRSCDDPQNDKDADFSAPYAVPLGHGTADTQLIVFDSSHATIKPYKADSNDYSHYFAELQAVDRLAAQAPHNFFLSHHPVLGFAPELSGAKILARPGNGGLQSVMSELHPGRLFGPGIDAALHGHIHLFEMVSFASGQPVTLVLGNAGSYRDLPLPSPLPAGTEPAPGAMVQNFTTTREFGFASLSRRGDDWLLTEWDVDGHAMFHCTLHGASGRCDAPAQD
jgi:hypothetical protein